MPETSIPWEHVAVKRWGQERSAPGQESVMDVSGRRFVVDTGVRVRRGTVQLDCRTDGDVAAHQAAFEAWHNSLDGVDNQIEVVPYAGKFEADLVVSPFRLQFSAIADVASGGSRVTAAVAGANNAANRALFARVFRPGAVVIVGGRRTTIAAVETALADGQATVVFTTADRLVAGSAVSETALPFDYSAYVGTTSLGAAEAGGARLVVAILPPTATSVALAYVDAVSGAPLLNDQLGSLATSPAGLFSHPNQVGGIAALADGAFLVVQNKNYPAMAILGADGQMERIDGTVSAVRLATAAASPVREPQLGAAVYGAFVYVVGYTGRFRRISLANLRNPHAGAFSATIATGPQNYVLVEALGQLANTRAVLGMWTATSGLRVLRQLSDSRRWFVSAIDLSAAPAVTATDVYEVTARSFRGSTEIGAVLYALAGDRVYRYSRRPDVSVVVGADAAAVRANLLAAGVELGATAEGVMSAVYGWEEIV